MVGTIVTLNYYIFEKKVDKLLIKFLKVTERQKIQVEKIGKNATTRNKTFEYLDKRKLRAQLRLEVPV